MVDLQHRFMVNDKETLPKLLELGYKPLSKHTQKYAYLYIDEKGRVLGRYGRPSQQEIIRLGIGGELHMYELMAMSTSKPDETPKVTEDG